MTASYQVSVAERSGFLDWGLREPGSALPVIDGTGYSMGLPIYTDSLQPIAQKRNFAKSNTAGNLGWCRHAALL
jgi:hypothetical protein